MDSSPQNKPQHHIRITNSTEDDFDYELICPDDGSCECWMECHGVHLAKYDDLCDLDFAHGLAHQEIAGMLCVEMPGQCWMQTRDLEFNYRTYPDGLYTFDEDSDFDSMGMFIIDMYPVGGAK